MSGPGVPWSSFSPPHSTTDVMGHSPDLIVCTTLRVSRCTCARTPRPGPRYTCGPTTKQKVFYNKIFDKNDPSLKQTFVLKSGREKTGTPKDGRRTRTVLPETTSKRVEPETSHHFSRSGRGSPRSPPRRPTSGTRKCLRRNRTTYRTTGSQVGH